MYIFNSARDRRLTPEERKRNSWGLSTKLSFNPGEPTLYPSSLPGFFPPSLSIHVKDGAVKGDQDRRSSFQDNWQTYLYGLAVLVRRIGCGGLRFFFSLFKYETMAVAPGTPAKVVSNPHVMHGLSHWKMKVDRFEQLQMIRSHYGQC